MSLLPTASGQESDTGVRRIGRFLVTYSRSTIWVSACLVGGLLTDVLSKGRL
jgi:hypothetical protein